MQMDRIDMGGYSPSKGGAYSMDENGNKIYDSDLPQRQPQMPAFDPAGQQGGYLGDPRELRKKLKAPTYGQDSAFMQEMLPDAPMSPGMAPYSYMNQFGPDLHGGYGGTGPGLPSYSPGIEFSWAKPNQPKRGYMR